MAQSKRKILLFLLAFICAVCVALFCASCSGDSTDNSSDSSSSSSDDGTGGGSGESGNTPEEEQTVWELIADNLGTDYTITVKDISITIPDIEAHQIYANTSGDVMFEPNGTVFFKVYDNTVTFDAGEMYISVSESNGDYTVVAYASGEITLDNTTYDYTEVYSAELYCDGETIYIIYSIEEDGEVADKYVITADYSYLSESVEDSTSDYDVSGIVEQLSAVTELTSLIESSSDLVTTALETIFTVTETTSGGYTLTLDYTALTALLNNLNDCTVAEFVDVYAGTGTYAGLQTLADSLGDMTVYNAISAIFTFTAEYGLSQESTYSLINSVVAAVTGSTFDFASLFASGGFLYTIGTMNFDEFLTTYLDMDTEDISLYLSAYSDLNAFEALYFSTDLYYYWYLETDEAFEYLMDCYTAITDTLSVVINVASDGSISTDINLTGFSAIFSEYTGATVSASGKISITSGATLPSGASAVATKGSDIYSGLLAAIATLDSDYITVNEGVAYYTDEDYKVAISTKGATILSVEYYNDNYYINIIDYTDSGYFETEINIYGYENANDTIYYEAYRDMTVYNTDGNVTKDIWSSGDYVYLRTYSYDEYGNRTYYGYSRSYKGVVQSSYSYNYTYDENGNQTYYAYTTTDGSGYSYSYTYDDHNNMTSRTYNEFDADKNVTYTSTSTYTFTYTYDDNGNLTSQVKVDGNNTYTYTYTYHENGSFATYSYVVINDGEIEYSWAYEYDTNSNITKEVIFDGYTTSTTTYDSDGNTLSYVRINGDYTYTTTYEYTNGNCTKVDYLREISGVEDFTYTRVYEYNSDGNCTLDSYENSNGVKRVYNYVYTNDNLTSETYKETDAENNVTSNWAKTYEYDTNGNRTYYEYKVFDAEGNVSSLSSTTNKYDNNGNWVGYVEVNVNNGYTYTTTYDFTVDYTLTYYSYVVTDADDEIYYSKKQTYTYNAKEQLTSKVYEYIENEVTTTITYAYTYSNNVLSAYTVDYVSGTTTAKYVITIGRNGYKASEKYTDNLGNSYEHTWNDDYYLLTSTYTTGADTEDEYSETYTYTYNSDNNYLTRKYENSNGVWYSYTYTYNDDGYRLTNKYENNEGYSETYTYTYNNYGNYLTLKYENNNEEWYSYTYTYYDNGTYKSEDYVSSDTSSHSFTYNEDGQYLSISYITSSGYTYGYTYTYDEDGNYLTKAYENSDNYSWLNTYTYDEDGYCIKAEYTVNGNFNYSYEYTYEEHGWVATEKYTDSAGSSTATYTYEILNEDYWDYYVEVTITYDSDETVETYTTWISKY